MRRTVYTAEHEAFRGDVRSFFEDEVRPEYLDWETAGKPPRWFWTRCAELGILGIGVPEEYGGTPGSTFKHSAVVTEEAQRLGLTLGGLRVQTDICMPYFLEYATEEQRERWLPRLTSGEAVSALAMSEPAAGSDMKAMATRARRDGAGDDTYVIDGGKTFITNGLSADLVVLAVKTDPDAGRRGISLVVVEASSDGFERGRKLEKLGLRTQDLSELFFTDMAVPVADRLGDENRGFEYLTNNLAQERLSIAINAQAAAVAALDATVRAVQESGEPADQVTKFALAGCHTDVAAGQAFTDRALDAHDAGELDAADAAAVKLYCTELQGTVADRCLQVLGAGAYNRVDPVGRAFADARVSRIYGGSTEIMKVIVAKAMGL